MSNHAPIVEELEAYGDRPAQGGMHPFWIVMIVLAAAGAVFMVLDGSNSETYFYEVHEAVAKAEDVKGEVVRVKGKVEKGSIIRTKGQLKTTFRITTKGQSMVVHYYKAMPDTFEEDRELVAQGKVNDRMEMTADEVVVKCPSRYEEQAPTAGKPGPQASNTKIDTKLNARAKTPQP